MYVKEATLRSMMYRHLEQILIFRGMLTQIHQYHLIHVTMHINEFGKFMALPDLFMQAMQTSPFQDLSVPVALRV